MNVRAARAWALLVGLTSLAPLAAFAQETAAPAVDAATKEDARKRFEAGRELDARGDVAGSLREFLASRALYKTRGNTLNAGIALRKLGRFDEALTLLESYLKDFPNSGADERAQVEAEINAAAQFVAKLEIDTTTPAQIVIDGAVVGHTPLSGPLRVMAGRRHVRVQPESYAAFAAEYTLDLVAQQTSRVRPSFDEMERSAGLSVKAADDGHHAVLLDGEVLGETPLTVQLPPRAYTLVLRGADGVGSLPQRVELVAGERSELKISTQQLSAPLELRVEPPEAELSIDGTVVGSAFRGMLPSGEHDIHASAPGYASRHLRVTLGAATTRLRVVLKPDGDGASGHSSPKEGAGGPSSLGGFADLDAGLAMGLVSGGDLRGECSGNCSAGLPLGPRVGLRAGVTFHRRLELGAELTYQHLAEKISDRDDQLTVVGRGAVRGVSHDVLKHHSVGVGALVGVRLGPARVPVTLRLAAGVMVGTVSDRRNGSFDAGAGMESAQATRVRDAASALYVAPEVRVGYAFSDHFSAGLGLRGTLAFDVAGPRWDAHKPTVLGRSGLGYWRGNEADGASGEKLVGAVRLQLDPLLYARYDF